VINFEQTPVPNGRILRRDAHSPEGCQISLDSFVHRQNVERYRKLLAESADEVQRQRLLKLLAEEAARPFGEPEIATGRLRTGRD
jgi:hypothetical protein